MDATVSQFLMIFFNDNLTLQPTVCIYCHYPSHPVFFNKTNKKCDQLYRFLECTKAELAMHSGGVLTF